MEMDVSMLLNSSIGCYWSIFRIPLFIIRVYLGFFFFTLCFYYFVIVLVYINIP